MSSNKNRNKTAAESKDEEVDELLRAAQDDVLLKLSLNSHIAHFGSSSSEFSGIDPDLDSRFQALMKPHQPKPKSKSKSKSQTKSKLDDASGSEEKKRENPEKILQDIDQSDDLFARFAALKASLPSYNSSSSAAVGVGNNQVQQQQLLMDDEDDGEEDEVEKMIKWAIDAARLDPSPPSDSDDNADDQDDTSDADDDSDDEDDDGHGVVGAGKKSNENYEMLCPAWQDKNLITL